MMKFLIWFLCILAETMLSVLITGGKGTLGLIPTVLLLGATFWLARTLCKKWDEYKEYRRSKAIYESYNRINETKSTNTSERKCKNCGAKLPDNKRICPLCDAEN